MVSTALPNVDWPARLAFVSRGLIVGLLVVWAIHFYPFDDFVDRAGSPLGADYPVFYLPGRMVLDGRADELYSHMAQQRRLHELFPTLDPGDWLPFRYPPFVAAAMTPLAALPYPASWLIFSSASLAALFIVWRMLQRRLTWLHNGSARAVAASLLFSWPIVWETLLGGQSSLFTLLILVATAMLADARRFTAAGAVLALGLFKPNALAFFALGVVLRYPRILRGAVTVAVVLVLLSAATVGWSGLGDYLKLGSQLAAGAWDVETDAAKVHGLGSWLTPIVPGSERIVLISLGIVATVAVVVVWRRAGDDRATVWSATAALVFLNLACNPYVPIYDLATLAAGVCFAIEARMCLLPQPRFAGDAAKWSVAVAALFLGPHVSQAICRAAGVQLFPLVLAAFTAWQLRQLVQAARAQGRREADSDSPGTFRSADRARSLAPGA